MSDPHYTDRIQAYQEKAAYDRGFSDCLKEAKPKKDFYDGRAEMKASVLKVIRGCLIADKSLAKLLKAIEEL